ncbi:MAG: hypothetical protein WA823_09130 [Candidatus Acidiferrales bacterium]
MQLFRTRDWKKRYVNVRSLRERRGTGRLAGCAMVLCVALAIAAPGVRAQNDQDKKDDNGFSAGVTVNTKADAKAVGLPVYPGSRPHKDNSDDSSAANLGLWGGSIGFKLSLMKLETDAAPQKVAEYYRKALGKYGKVLDCTNAPALTQEQKDANEKSNTLACDDDHAKAGEVIYKVGKRDDQRIVNVEPNGTGSVYSLVYLSTKGMDK